MRRMYFRVDPGSQGPEPVELAPRHSELVTRNHGLPEGVQTGLGERLLVGGLVALGPVWEYVLDRLVDSLQVMLP